MGEPGAEHLLIAIVVRGKGGACDILRALGADRHRIRFETKKRAWPSSFPEGGARPTAQPLGVRSVPVESVGELDFGD